jgi:hypothetical protein
MFNQETAPELFEVYHGPIFQLEEQLAIYDQLDAAARARLDEHIETCPTCRQKLAAYRLMDRRLAGLPDAPPAPALRAHFYAALANSSAFNLPSSAFPPQQALTYPTFPHSLFDDPGGVTESTSRQGGLAVDDARTGGIRVMTNEQGQAVPPGAGAVTATLTVHLSNLYRQVNLPLDWQGRRATPFSPGRENPRSCICAPAWSC